MYISGTNKMDYLWLLLGIQMCIQMFIYSVHCSSEVCLTWKVTQNELVLTCKVNPLIFRVQIVDPFNNIQAECTAPIPVSNWDNCYSYMYYKNVTIKQYAITEKTVFEVRGKIDNRVNGIWSCTHGTGRENASVEVTVLTIPTNNSAPRRLNDMSYNLCLREAALTGMSSFMFATIIYCLGTIFLTELNEWNMYKVCRNWDTVRILTFVYGLIVLALLASMCATSECEYNWVVALVTFVFGIASDVLYMRKSKRSSENSELSNNHSQVKDIHDPPENTTFIE